MSLDLVFLHLCTDPGDPFTLTGCMKNSWNPILCCCSLMRNRKKVLQNISFLLFFITKGWLQRQNKRFKVWVFEIREASECTKKNQKKYLKNFTTFGLCANNNFYSKFYLLQTNPNNFFQKRYWGAMVEELLTHNVHKKSIKQPGVLFSI